MGEIKPATPAMLVLAAFSRYPAALDWACARAVEQWGPISITSEVLPFEDTTYYERSMGSGLKKVLVGFQSLIDPGVLVDAKRQMNGWEDDYRDMVNVSETRPLNLDPGYLTQAKLVLATTKDRDHRVYLDRGIYAEVTLHYQRGRGWQPRDWTYSDYRSARYHQFLDRCRAYLREQRHA